MADSLAALQQRFYALVTGDGPDEHGDDLIDAPDPMAAARRLSIYRDGYVARFAVALRLEYPRVVAELGPTFRRIVTEYVAAHPPVAGPIRAVGRDFAMFLEASGHPVERIALARLEWARCEAFAAGTHVPLAVATLTALPPDRWGDVLLRLGPSVRRAGGFVAWRRGERTVERALTDGEADALDQIGDGVLFAALCERLLERVGDDAPAIAFGLLRRWLADELLVDTLTDTRATPPSPTGPAS